MEFVPTQHGRASTYSYQTRRKHIKYNRFFLIQSHSSYLAPYLKKILSDLIIKEALTINTVSAANMTKIKQ